MEQNYYLAVDIGASSGRHMLAWLEDGKIRMEEIYRFENGIRPVNGHLCWDLDGLFREILEGMRRCGEAGKIPSCMGLDTWAVDFVLLDGRGERIGDSVSYRDGRTKGMDEKVYRRISEKDLYARTGIQKQIFNTIYQIMAIKDRHPEQLEAAKDLLLIPDYLNYLLTGEKKTEYTNATTTQLVSPVTKDWDRELIQTLGFPEGLFGAITLPGTRVGSLKPEIRQQVGYDVTVIQTATHDTASAVVSVPSTEDHLLYISSGTWSLMGTERPEADCGEASRKANLTNEGGYDYRFRYLKNIMGLWMIQSVRHEWGNRYSFAEICAMAEKENAFPSRVDANDDTFLAPESMIRAVQDFCARTGQRVPETPGQIAAVIYRSLAECYGKTIREVEALTGRNYDCIYVVGGGSHADYLNRLTAEATGKTIVCGPGEATAIGNLAVQMIAMGDLENLNAARACIADSFPQKVFR